MISFVSSSALERFLGQKTHTRKIVGPLRYCMYLAACLVHGALTSCKHELFLTALQAATGGSSPAEPASKQRQPPAYSHVTKAAGQHCPLSKPSSAWEQFMDAEAETSQAKAEADSPTGSLTAADSSQKSPTQPYITGVKSRHGLQPQSLALSGPGSKVLQQAQHGTSRCTNRSGSLPQAEPTGSTDSQQSHAGDQPSDGKQKPNATPAAIACKPLVPIFSKQKQHAFKPPEMVPDHQGNSQCKAPSWQTSSPAQAAQDAGHKPAIVFDELYAVARHVAVPTSFASLHSYQQSWCSAVTEEINIRCTPPLATSWWPAITWTALSWVAWVTGRGFVILGLKLKSRCAQLPCNIWPDLGGTLAICCLL